MSVVNQPTDFATLIELLRWRALHQPQQRAYTFLEDGEGRELHLSYHELDRQARAVAAHLQRLGAEGERVLLLYPSGLDYIAAFFGCLYAGAIAVPVYPPRPNRSLGRLQAVAENCGAKFALTTSEQNARMQHSLDEAGLPGLRWLHSDAIAREPHGADAWREPGAGCDTLAFLQYTSGSTARPKGVMVTHGNLLSNNRMVRHAFEQDERSDFVGWLPLFHDMGLIGNVLQPLYLGSSCVLMSPEAFLTRPLRWLQAVSHYRAHTSGGPNFAFDLCARKITPEQRQTLDLSHWQVAFCGAEPVRSETLDAFAQAFEPCGFRREAFYPCYGLAEASLFVSGGSQKIAPVVTTFSCQSLQRDLAAPALDADDERTLVGYGRAWLESEIIIADPHSCAPASAGSVGEVWVRGPHIARGYWNDAEQSQWTFEASLTSSGHGPFLRTGDLGFIDEGELFLTGRLKDVMILGGRNHYPDDIEQTVEASHPLLRPAGCAAFSVDIDGAERLIVVAEVERAFFSTRPEPNSASSAQSNTKSNGEVLVNTLRQAVAEQHDLRPHAIVLLKPAALPKTSSGKKQRHACRAAFLARTLADINAPKTDDSNREAFR